MVTLAWETINQFDPSKTYLAYAGYAERKSPWSYFNYLMRARKVQKQLNTSKGLIGFTAKLEFFSKKVVQLAVFEDAAALKEFANTGQHALCAKQTKESMNWLKNATWSISGAEMPPKLEDAISRAQNQK
jgi:hypothetical protein